MKAVFAKAATVKRLIFVDCYTEWCGPCKGMAATVFTQDSVADFFNRTFINVKMDMEKSEGPALKEKYNVGAFPTYLLLDTSGNLIYKFVGGMTADSFLYCIKKGIDPNNKVVFMNRQYKEGNRSKAFLREFIKLKIELKEIRDAQLMAEEYFKMLTVDERTSPENWYLFGENRYQLYLSDVGSYNFNYLADNWQSFAKANGNEIVEAKLENIYMKTAEYALRGWYLAKNKDWYYAVSNDASDFKRYRTQIEATQLKDKKDLIVLMNIAEAATVKDTADVVNILAEKITSLSSKDKKIFYSFLSMINGNNSVILKMPKTKVLLEKVIQSSTEQGMVNLAKNYLNKIHG